MNAYPPAVLIAWDVTKNQRIERPASVGTFGQISFARLARSLKEAGEIADNEHIVAFEVCDDGMVKYRVEPCR